MKTKKIKINIWIIIVKKESSWSRKIKEKTKKYKENGQIEKGKNEKKK